MVNLDTSFEVSTHDETKIRKHRIFNLAFVWSQMLTFEYTSCAGVMTNDSIPVYPVTWFCTELGQVGSAAKSGLSVLIRR